MFVTTYTTNKTELFNLGLELLEPQDLTLVTEIDGKPLAAPHVAIVLSQQGTNTLVANFGATDALSFIGWLNHDHAATLKAIGRHVK